MSPAPLFSSFSLGSVLLSLSSGPIMQRVLSDWTTYCFSSQYHCVRDCVHLCKCVCTVCNLLSDVISIFAVESGEESRLKDKTERKKDLTPVFLSFQGPSLALIREMQR